MDQNAEAKSERPQALQPPSETVLEMINSAIEGHNRAVARLIQIRDKTSIKVLGMQARDLRELAFPENPF